MSTNGIWPNGSKPLSDPKPKAGGDSTTVKDPPVVATDYTPLYIVGAVALGVFVATKK
jgi:hypothetical protein